MPLFRYLLDHPRVYHDHGLVEPGDERDLDAAPDQHWVELDEHRNLVAPPATPAELTAPSLEAMSVPEVLAFLAANPAQAPRLTDLERAGKARKGVLEVTTKTEA